MWPLLAKLLAVNAAPLTLEVERTGFAESGPYAEVQALCRELSRRWPGRVRCRQFGTTPEGRPMLVLAASDDGVLTPPRAAARRRPVLLAIGGIHAGEIDGKDAGFLLLRDLLEGRTLPGVLAQVTLLFVPVFNVDGHAHRGPNRRPNQVGPAETGWRSTAQNLNLNRDWMKADAKEMRAMLGLLAAWDPLVLADLHVTDGAQFQPDVSVLVAPLLEGPAPMRPLAQALHDALLTHLKSTGHLPVDFYPELLRPDEPASGFTATVYPPRFSHSYWGLRHRLAVLVETHSWKDYRTRVGATVDTLTGILGALRKHGARWRSEALALDAEVTRHPPERVPLAFEPTARTETLAFPGVAFERVPAPAIGGSTIRYQPDRPEVWNVPFHPGVRATSEVRVPRGGYLVPSAWAELVRGQLQLHGLRFLALTADARADVEVFRIVEAKPSSTPFEGRQRLAVTGAWVQETRTLPSGTLFVPTAQRHAELLVHLLDPDAPDGLLAWGFFNAAFQEQEFIEPYVLEPWAAAELQRNGALRAELEARMADPAFAADPEARRRFFAKRHPSVDARVREGPVLRTDTPLH